MNNEGPDPLIHASWVAGSLLYIHGIACFARLFIVCTATGKRVST